MQDAYAPEERYADDDILIEDHVPELRGEAQRLLRGWMHWPSWRERGVNAGLESAGGAGGRGRPYDGGDSARPARQQPSQTKQRSHGGRGLSDRRLRTLTVNNQFDATWQPGIQPCGARGLYRVSEILARFGE